MAFLGLTYVGPQSTFQYLDKEPNTFNDEVKANVAQEELPEELRRVEWAHKPPNLAELYADETPLRVMQQETAAKTKKTVTEFVSAEVYRDMSAKHCRVRNDPQAKWHTPITSSQKYGWTDQSCEVKPQVANTEKHPKNSSEESRYAEAMLRQGMI
eukprot:TRINITY_DN13338_c0_g1_i1.p1 TRINITY_DN13338_c0_g1~~TRINITY_DN13338_c0_g1_i1.p1  ORF type:complete len:156 (+),score=62.77 TRINITY_DN13338_c0_g1_i1:58-525(+)